MAKKVVSFKAKVLSDGHLSPKKIKLKPGESYYITISYADDNFFENWDG